MCHEAFVGGSVKGCQVVPLLCVVEAAQQSANALALTAAESGRVVAARIPGFVSAVVDCPLTLLLTVDTQLMHLPETRRPLVVVAE